MAIKIVTDSICDLPEAIMAEYGITVVPLYINPMCLPRWIPLNFSGAAAA